MRKLLYSLLSLSVVSSTPLAVISCSKENTNDYFKQFENHIKKNESFIYYIGAKNCTHCHSTNVKIWSKLFKDGSLTEEGKEEKAKLDLKHPDMVKPINLKGYYVEVEDFKDWTNQSGEWAKELKKWVANKILELPELQISGEKDKTLSVDNINFNGTPMFIFINNGKFAGYTSGASTMEEAFFEKIENHLYYQDWFDKDEYITASKEPTPDKPEGNNPTGPKPETKN